MKSLKEKKQQLENLKDDLAEAEEQVSRLEGDIDELEHEIKEMENSGVESVRFGTGIIWNGVKGIVTGIHPHTKHIMAVRKWGKTFLDEQFDPEGGTLELLPFEEANALYLEYRSAGAI